MTEIPSGNIFHSEPYKGDDFDHASYETLRRIMTAKYPDIMVRAGNCRVDNWRIEVPPMPGQWMSYLLKVGRALPQAVSECVPQIQDGSGIVRFVSHFSYQTPGSDGHIHYGARLTSAYYDQSDTWDYWIRLSTTGVYLFEEHAKQSGDLVPWSDFAVFAVLHEIYEMDNYFRDPVGREKSLAVWDSDYRWAKHEVDADDRAIDLMRRLWKKKYIKDYDSGYLTIVSSRLASQGDALRS